MLKWTENDTERLLFLKIVKEFMKGLYFKIEFKVGNIVNAYLQEILVDNNMHNHLRFGEALQFRGEIVVFTENKNQLFLDIMDIDNVTCLQVLSDEEFLV